MSGLEVNGINVIAEAERRGRPRDLFATWFAANISVLGLSYGAWLLAFGQSFWASMAGLTVGVLGSFLLVGLASLAGQRGSAPTMVLSRAAFGVRGNALPTFVSYLSLVGWEVILVSLAVLMSRTVTLRLFGGGGEIAMALTFVAIVAAIMVSGVRGFSSIMRVQGVITWATALLTAGYLLLIMERIDLSALDRLPKASPAGISGLVVFCLTGFGLSWVCCAADYSRYLPRKASGRAVVLWTTLGAATPLFLLTTAGLLLGASDPQLSRAIAVDPIGALTQVLPIWYVVPFALVAFLGLVAGAILDIYSSGLTLLSLGLPVQRWQAVCLDGLLVTAGTAYVIWVAQDFLGTFQGFLLTLGVPMATWVGIFLGDLWLRRGSYDDAALFDPQGRYGRVNGIAIVLFCCGSLLGWGLVVNRVLTWQGYLLGPFGGKEGAFAQSGAGVLAALLIGFSGISLLGRARIRRQERPGPGVNAGHENVADRNSRPPMSESA